MFFENAKKKLQKKNLQFGGGDQHVAELVLDRDPHF